MRNVLTGIVLICVGVFLPLAPNASASPRSGSVENNDAASYPTATPTRVWTLPPTATPTSTRTAMPTPQISFAANPKKVVRGYSSDLSWDVLNAEVCDLNDELVPLSKLNRPTGPLFANKTFTLFCTNTDGHNSSALTISVVTPTPQPTFTATPSPTVSPRPSATPTATPTACPTLASRYYCNSEYALKFRQFEEGGIFDGVGRMPERDPNCTNSSCSCSFSYTPTHDRNYYGWTANCDFVFHNDPTTATKLCQLMGYATYNPARLGAHGFRSPGNNSILYWVPSKNNFVLKSASESNSFIDRIECSNPIACSTMRTVDQRPTADRVCGPLP